MRDEDGFSIVELVVALAVLTVVMTATASSVTSALGLARDSRARTVAANLATEQMELQRTLAFDEHINTLGTTQVTPPPVAGVPYQVTITKSWAAQNSTTGACEVVGTGQNANLAYIAVDIQVSWAEMGSTQPVRSSTLLAPPNSTYSPYLGHIAVRVVDREGAGAPGHTVTVSGGPTAVTPRATDANGCALFPFLRQGTYTVRVETPAHVSAVFTGGQFVPAPTQQVAVVPGATQTVGPLEYEPHADLTLRLEGPAGGTPPPGLEVTVRNDRLLAPSGSVTRTVTSPALVMRVFPDRAGFGVRMGDPACPDHLTPPVSMTPAPGQPLTSDPLLATLRVTATAFGVPQPNLALTIQATSANCPGTSYSVPTTTDVNGQALLALPYGRYTITDAYYSTDAPQADLRADPSAYDVELRIG